MFQIAEVARQFKKRAIFALTMCIMLTVVTLDWRFEAAKVIAMCATVTACVFDRKGKWFWFLCGIALGDLLLYLFK
jgi:hypothetical protein